jgi:hypothetical protein
VFLRGLIILVGSFGMPVYTFVFPISYLTKNNCGILLYVFVMPLWPPMAEAWFSVIILSLSDGSAMVTGLSHTIILVEES